MWLSVPSPARATTIVGTPSVTARSATVHALAGGPYAHRHQQAAGPLDQHEVVLVGLGADGVDHLVQLQRRHARRSGRRPAGPAARGRRRGCGVVCGAASRVTRSMSVGPPSAVPVWPGLTTATRSPAACAAAAMAAVTMVLPTSVSVPVTSTMPRHSPGCGGLGPAAAARPSAGLGHRNGERGDVGVGGIHRPDPRRHRRLRQIRHPRPGRQRLGSGAATAAPARAARAGGAGESGAGETARRAGARVRGARGCGLVGGRHGAHSTITSRARSKSAAGTPAFRVSRSRDEPSGVDGGRKQPTATPRSRQSAAQARAASGPGAGTDSTPAGRCGDSKPGRAQPAHGQLGPGRQRRPAVVGAAGDPQGGPHPGDDGGRRCGVVDEGAAGVDQVPDQRRAGPATTPPAPPSDLDRVAVTTTSGCPARPAAATRAGAVRAEDAERVGVVDQQQRAVGRGHRVQLGERGQVAVDGEDRLGDDHRRAARVRPPAIAATAAGSACGATTASAPESRQPSISEAWL